MKKKLFLWQLSGFLFTCILGTLLHFVYDWSGQNVVAAVFSGINESTWEHMKILFVPMFFFALVEKHLLCDPPENYWCVKLKGIFLGLFMIPFLFYSYNGIIGTSPAWVNIVIFYVSAFSAYFYEQRLFQKGKPCLFSQTMAFSFICIIALAFLIFTFVQPPLEIFRDPVTGSFGR